jgi:hypothetical protein
MRLAIRMAGPLGYAALVCAACLGSVACGGEVALNGLAPVDAGPPKAPGVARLDAGPPGAPNGATETSTPPALDASAPGSTCGPSNCHGCCDPDGYCQDGVDILACGTGGVACHVCPSEALICSAGACLSPARRCTSSTCNGCCDANDNCTISGISSCGTGGVACQDCASMNLVCAGDTCVPPFDSTCGPSICRGCCDFTGYCQDGVDVQACGTGGVACQDCASANLVCAGNSCVSPADGSAYADPPPPPQQGLSTYPLPPPAPK